MNQEPNQKSIFPKIPILHQQPYGRKFITRRGAMVLQYVFCLVTERSRVRILPATTLFFQILTLREFMQLHGKRYGCDPGHDRVLLVRRSPRVLRAPAPYRVQDAFPIMWIIKRCVEASPPSYEGHSRWSIATATRESGSTEYSLTDQSNFARAPIQARIGRLPLRQQHRV